MADENELEQSPKKSKTMLIVIIVVGLNLAIGGVVVAIVMSDSGASEAAPKQAAPAVRMPGSGPGPIIQLENFVVNIQSDEGTRYLKAAVAIELTDASVQEAFTQWDKLVRNEVLIYLSSLEIAETITAKQKRVLENDLKGIINKRIGADLVSGVYFTEFVTQ